MKPSPNARRPTNAVGPPDRQERNCASPQTCESGLSLRLPKACPTGILAVGGELKASVCLYKGDEAWLSRPFGNLTDPQTYRSYVQSIEQWMGQAGFTPALIAHDLHPLYMSTHYARALKLPTVAVQHHHAHIVSIMADAGMEGPAVGVCCDGVGYGSDGAAWGCEVMACDASSFERLSHLQYFPLFGGDAAAVETWRPAAALLQQALGEQWRKLMPQSFSRVPEEDLDAFDRITSSTVHLSQTSSLGRVFDAISFMLGLCDRNEREAQAAIALEATACSEPVEAYPYETTTCSGSSKMSLAPLVRAIVKDLRAGKDVGGMSARFHEAVARMLAGAAVMACEMTGVSTVVLSGGCFANRRLLSRMVERLEERRLTVVQSRRVSCGDASLALGQAVAAAAMRERAGGCA